MKGSANFIENGDYYPYTDKNELTTISTHRTEAFVVVLEFHTLSFFRPYQTMGWF